MYSELAVCMTSEIWTLAVFSACWLKCFYKLEALIFASVVGASLIKLLACTSLHVWCEMQPDHVDENITCSLFCDPQGGIFGPVLISVGMSPYGYWDSVTMPTRDRLKVRGRGRGRGG